jgi:hypothetical protein
LASFPASSFILLLSSPLSSEHGADVISDEAIELCTDVGSAKGFGCASVLGDSVTSDERINDGSEVSAGVVTAFCCERFGPGVGTNLCCRFA